MTAGGDWSLQDLAGATCGRALRLDIQLAVVAALVGDIRHLYVLQGSSHLLLLIGQSCQVAAGTRSGIRGGVRGCCGYVRRSRFFAAASGKKCASTDGCHAEGRRAKEEISS